MFRPIYSGRESTTIGKCLTHQVRTREFFSFVLRFNIKDETSICQLVGCGMTGRHDMT